MAERVITVRMTEALHKRLIDVAHASHVSMNALAVAVLAKRVAHTTELRDFGSRCKEVPKI